MTLCIFKLTVVWKIFATDINETNRNGSHKGSHQFHYKPNIKISSRSMLRINSWLCSCAATISSKCDRFLEFPSNPHRPIHATIECSICCGLHWNSNHSGKSAAHSFRENKSEKSGKMTLKLVLAKWFRPNCNSRACHLSNDAWDRRAELECF